MSNEIIETATVADLDPDEKPNLTYSDLTQTVDHVLSEIGVEHDRDSIIREDSYQTVWYEAIGDEYVEVWACHYAVPHLGYTVYRLR